MDTDTLELLIKIIESYKKKSTKDFNIEEAKNLLNEFALNKTDEELIDYTSMMDYSMSIYEFRVLLIEIYENL